MTARAVPRVAPPLEKREQVTVARVLRAAGFVVGSTSQTRRSRQMIGLPDLVLWHEGLKLAGWWECKRYQVRGYDPARPATWRPEPLTEAQAEVRRMALACGQLHGWGGHREAWMALVQLGLASGGADGQPFMLRPRRESLNRKE